MQAFSNAIFTQLCSSWQDFNWYSTSHGPFFRYPANNSSENSKKVAVV